ncbi:MAG TPA: hypothetical protein VIM89_09195 [Mucilaginibacter sp.]
MKVKITSLIAICLLFFSITSFAQDESFNDYIITLKNDTIKCELHSSNNVDWFKYQIEGVKGSKKLNADSINGYYSSKDSVLFLSKHTPGPGGRTFLQLLERGQINLYELNSGSDTYWYEEKNGDSLKLIKMYRNSVHIGDNSYEANTSRKERQQNLFNALADNPELLQRFKNAIKDVNYGFKLIQYYIKTYNDEYFENHKSSK